MNRMFNSILVLSVAFLLTFARLAPAQSTTQRADETKTWTTSAQPTSQPALRYRLLPPLWDQKPGNAAPAYYTAALMHHNTGDRDQFADRLDEWLDRPIDQMPLDQVRPILSGTYRELLQQLDIAARREHCHWDHALRERGLSAFLPELSELRFLSRWLRLRLRVEIIDRQHDAALRTLQTGFAMAHHIGQGRTLVSGMVAAGIAQNFIDSAREFAASPGAPNLYWGWADLPRPMFDISRYYESERVAATSTVHLDQIRPDRPLSSQQINDILDAMSTWSLRGTLIQNRAGFAMRAAGELPRSREFLLKDGVTREQLEALPPLQVALLYYARSIEYAFDATARYTRLPFHIGFPAALADQSYDDIVDAHPFGRLLPPSASRLWRRLATIDREIAAMQVTESSRAHAAAQNGQLPGSLDALRELPAPIDPLTNKPFTYETSGGDTFTLTAPAVTEDDPPLRYQVKITR